MFLPTLALALHMTSNLVLDCVQNCDLSRDPVIKYVEDYYQDVPNSVERSTGTFMRPGFLQQYERDIRKTVEGATEKLPKRTGPGFPAGYSDRFSEEDHFELSTDRATAARPAKEFPQRRYDAFGQKPPFRFSDTSPEPDPYPDKYPDIFRDNLPKDMPPERPRYMDGGKQDLHENHGNDRPNRPSHAEEITKDDKRTRYPEEQLDNRPFMPPGGLPDRRTERPPFEMTTRLPENMPKLPPANPTIDRTDKQSVKSFVGKFPDNGDKFADQFSDIVAEEFDEDFEADEAVDVNAHGETGLLEEFLTGRDGRVHLGESVPKDERKPEEAGGQYNQTFSDFYADLWDIYKMDHQDEVLPPLHYNASVSDDELDELEKRNDTLVLYLEVKNKTADPRHHPTRPKSNQYFNAEVWNLGEANPTPYKRKTPIYNGREDDQTTTTRTRFRKRNREREETTTTTESVLRPRTPSYRSFAKVQRLLRSKFHRPFDRNINRRNGLSEGQKRKLTQARAKFASRGYVKVKGRKVKKGANRRSDEDTAQSRHSEEYFTTLYHRNKPSSLKSKGQNYKGHGQQRPKQRGKKKGQEQQLRSESLDVKRQGNILNQLGLSGNRDLSNDSLFFTFLPAFLTIGSVFGFTISELFHDEADYITFNPTIQYVGDNITFTVVDNDTVTNGNTNSQTAQASNDITNMDTSTIDTAVIPIVINTDGEFELCCRDGIVEMFLSVWLGIMN